MCLQPKFSDSSSCFGIFMFNTAYTLTGALKARLFVVTVTVILNDHNCDYMFIYIGSYMSECTEYRGHVAHFVVEINLFRLNCAHS